MFASASKSWSPLPLRLIIFWEVGCRSRVDLHLPGVDTQDLLFRLQGKARSEPVLVAFLLCGPDSSSSLETLGGHQAASLPVLSVLPPYLPHRQRVWRGSPSPAQSSECCPLHRLQIILGLNYIFYKNKLALLILTSCFNNCCSTSLHSSFEMLERQFAAYRFLMRQMVTYADHTYWHRQTKYQSMRNPMQRSQIAWKLLFKSCGILEKQKTPSDPPPQMNQTQMWLAVFLSSLSPQVLPVPWWLLEKEVTSFFLQ